MKRFGDLWPDFIENGNALAAVMDGTVEKRKKASVRKLLYSDEEAAEDPTRWHAIDPKKAAAYTAPLLEALEAGTWKHGVPRHVRRFCRNKTAGRGKWRDLYIASLPDHIVHHMAVNVTKPALIRGMHPHCCGSVPGRGIRHILESVKHWLKDDKACRYFVKLDIRRYFDNISAEILMEKLRKKIKDERVLAIHEQIIQSAPVACPVGYYPSPFYANLYLEDLDWFIEQDLFKIRRGKQIKWVRHYLRYMDDMLLIGTSKTDLYKAVRAIKQRLMEELGLQIKNSWEIRKIGVMDRATGKLKPGGYWIDIGGYKFCKGATILRDRIYLDTRRLAKRMKRRGNYTLHQAESMQSRIGWMMHCDSYGFMQREIRPNVDLKRMKEKISHVEKKRKRQQRETRCTGKERKHYDRPAGIQSSGSNRGNRRSLEIR